MNYLRNVIDMTWIIAIVSFDSVCVCARACNECIYTYYEKKHIGSRLDYLRFELIYLINLNNQILTIIN